MASKNKILKVLNLKNNNIIEINQSRFNKFIQVVTDRPSNTFKGQLTQTFKLRGKKKNQRAIGKTIDGYSNNHFIGSKTVLFRAQNEALNFAISKFIFSHPQFASHEINVVGAGEPMFLYTIPKEFVKEDKKKRTLRQSALDYKPETLRDRALRYNS